jgi:hypothetical protein
LHYLSCDIRIEKLGPWHCSKKSGIIGIVGQCSL